MKKQKQPLDYMDDLPIGMKRYFKHYGYNINEKLYGYLHEQMTGRDGDPLEQLTKDQYDDFLNRYGVKLENDCLCNGRYVLDCARAELYHSSIEDEQHLAKYVKDIIDNRDAADGEVFDGMYGKMIKRGIPIDWDELI